MAKFMDLFDKEQKALACKVLDYYDGKSKKHLMEFLQVYRAHALSKGVQARTRNIVKMVADKSGLLFNDKAPTIQVYVGEDVDEAASVTVQQIFESADWIEFFTNFDVCLRLLKTAYVLVQINPENGDWMFEMLDQHNCAVHLDAFKKLDTLIYSTGKDDQGRRTFRVWTNEVVQDLIVDEHGGEELLNAQPNPFGIIPASVFHDTNVPRDGAWNVIPEDLVEVNDIYNLHVTDSEYTSMWMKQPTLFHNTMIEGGTSGQMVAVQHPGEPLPRWVPSTDPGFVGGPGSSVAVEAVGGQAVFMEYLGPDVNLMPLDEMVNKWVSDYAADWSVRVAAEGNGTADSGFKLVVQELPNLELRRQRQRMFEAGFNRLYEVIKAISNVVGIILPPTSQLFVKFGPASLPVDEKASEDVWAARIAGGRADRVMYFMEKLGMSKEEAQAKVTEVQDNNKVQNVQRAPVTNTASSVLGAQA